VEWSYQKRIVFTRTVSSKMGNRKLYTRPALPNTDRKHFFTKRAN